ncbi:MAG TPA: 50S ribosomal protein L25 [Trueperaceae bacterium]|nr:50S ribosomal protein L25 [Trueperaceae bacterium]
MKLEAEKRSAGHVAALRKGGRLPGVVYNSLLNLTVSVDGREFDRVFRSQGMSSIIDLAVDGDTHAVLVKQVQMDKRHRRPMHVDFYAVTEGQVVDVHVPIEISGTAIGVREGGMLDVHRREIYIEVMPRLIPNHVVVDVSELAIGDSIHIADVASLLPPEAHVLDDLERTVLTVVPPRLVEEEEAAEEEVGEGVEPELIGHGGAEEGAAEEGSEEDGA